MENKMRLLITIACVLFYLNPSLAQKTSPFSLELGLGKGILSNSKHYFKSPTLLPILGAHYNRSMGKKWFYSVGFQYQSRVEKYSKKSLPGIQNSYTLYNGKLKLNRFMIPLSIGCAIKKNNWTYSVGLGYRWAWIMQGKLRTTIQGYYGNDEPWDAAREEEAIIVGSENFKFSSATYIDFGARRLQYQNQLFFTLKGKWKEKFEFVGYLYLYQNVSVVRSGKNYIYPNMLDVIDRFEIPGREVAITCNYYFNIKKTKVVK